MNTQDKCPHCGATKVEGREFACGFILRPGVKYNPRTHECLLNSERTAHAATMEREKSTSLALGVMKLTAEGWESECKKVASQLASTRKELEEAKSDAKRWCPDRCPITLRLFFMWLEHPTKGYVPTYGGPLDSYTIPEPDMPEEGKKTEFHDIEFHCERYDHDEGAWVEGFEDPGHRVILQDRLVDLDELETLSARVRELEVELSQSFELAENQLGAEKLSGNIVKEEFWKGELAALHRMRRALGKTIP